MVQKMDGLLDDPKNCNPEFPTRYTIMWQNKTTMASEEQPIGLHNLLSELSFLAHNQNNYSIEQIGQAIASYNELQGGPLAELQGRLYALIVIHCSYSFQQRAECLNMDVPIANENTLKNTILQNFAEALKSAYLLVKENQKIDSSYTPLELWEVFQTKKQTNIQDFSPGPWSTILSATVDAWRIYCSPTPESVSQMETQLLAIREILNLGPIQNPQFKSVNGRPTPETLRAGYQIYEENLFPVEGFSKAIMDDPSLLDRVTEVLR